jgi:hypothetical protein
MKKIKILQYLPEDNFEIVLLLNFVSVGFGFKIIESAVFKVPPNPINP